MINLPIIYIDSQSRFEEAIRSLSKKERVYIDLEFDKNHFKYGFNLCLVQIFDEEQVFLIDPLADLEIKTLFPLIENENIQKVAFAFGEDMRLLHYLGCTPANILDLAVLLSLLNHEHLSLSNAIVEFLGEQDTINNTSSQQMSNWCLRPLKKKQFFYAAEDVIYLPKLFNELQKRIIQLNRLPWVKEEMEFYENADWESGEISNFLVPRDRRQLTLRQWIRFEKWMSYREKMAQQLNLPSYKVIDKKVFLFLAEHPDKVDDWTNLKGIHRQLKVNKVTEKLKRLLSEAEKEITDNNIPIELPAYQQKINIDPDWKAKKQRYQLLRNEIYLPIKYQIQKEYGEHFANFILSNKKIEEFIHKERKFLPYQKKIVKNLAKKLDINTSLIIEQLNV